MEVRICTECKSSMTEGFCINEGEEYYCSKKCLHKHYNEEEYLQMYDECLAYWTQWEE